MKFTLAFILALSFSSAMAENYVVLQEDGEFHSSILTPQIISTTKSRSEALRQLKDICKRNYGGKIVKHVFSETKYIPSTETHVTIARGYCVY